MEVPTAPSQHVVATSCVTHRALVFVCLSCGIIRGHGPASEEELEGLANTTELLVQEWIKSGGQPTPEAQ